MTLARPVGPGAAARKYDLLTALGALALTLAPGEQRLVLRLMVAITARYNWTSDRLAVGQAELARLWAVDERTVKRAMAEYRARGWLRQMRPATRGRVAEYALGLSALMTATRPVWPAVGPDFEARLAPPEPAATIVPFPQAPLPEPDGTLWPRALHRLAEGDPATARAWLGGLTEEGVQDGTLTLRVPGRYQANYIRTHLMDRLLAAVRHVAPGIEGVALSCD